MQNKKGTDKILSIYWFVILTLIAGGVFAMVYVFYGAPYDVREIETGLLAEKIADCISKQGVIDSEFFSGDGNFNTKINENFMQKCKITFDVEKGYTAGEIQYFYEVQFFSLNDLENEKFSLAEGNKNWKQECSIKDENSKEYKRLVKCTERRFYAVGEQNQQYLIKILAIVGKSEKNVKQ